MPERCAKLLLIAGAAALMAACAGPSRNYRTSINSKVAAGDYVGALTEIDAEKNSQYGEKNAVLYYLDHGMLLHDIAQYPDSDKDFAEAERVMDELFTKSVSRGAGTFLINDNTTKYPGEVFERALMNVFRALNFVFLGNNDDALVEARKVTSYLARFNDFMQGKSGFTDSAFAQYLSAMLFEQNGDRDDARIAYAAAGKAFQKYSADYGMQTPVFNVPAYSELAKKNLGEIVFLHYNGPAPMKVSKTFQVAWNDALLAVNQTGAAEADSGQFYNALNAGVLGSAITVAYPEYVQDPYNIGGAVVKTDDAQAETLLMENVSGIAWQTLAMKNDAIRARAVARAAIKFILARAASKEVEKQAGQGWGLLASVVANVASAATEVADTRGWTTLPAEIRMARLAVKPGLHDVTVSFMRRDGTVDGTITFSGVNVEKGRRTYLHYRTAR